MAIQNGNQETGASVIEVAEAEHMVRTTGYLTSIEDIQSVPLKVTDKGTPLLLGDIADINIGHKCAVAFPSLTAKAKR